MNILQKFLWWRRDVRWNKPMRDMIWLDRVICVTWSRSLLKETCHFNWPAKDVMPKRGVKIVRVNMKSNGPDCTTKRWWFYTPRGAFRIDLDSMYFS